MSAERAVVGGDVVDEAARRARATARPGGPWADRRARRRRPRPRSRACRRTLSSSRRYCGQRLPDVVGTVLLGAGIGAAALGISQGPEWGWGDARTVGALVFAAVAVALALLALGAARGAGDRDALWRSRRFAAANLASLLYGAALFPWMLVGVLFLIGVWGYSPLEAGLAMTPGALIAAVVALRAGPVVARRGPWAVIAGGALVLAARRPDLRRR